MSNFAGYIFLFLAIILGIASNGFLKSTNGFTIITPTIFCILSIIDIQISKWPNKTAR